MHGVVLPHWPCRNQDLQRHVAASLPRCWTDKVASMLTAQEAAGTMPSPSSPARGAELLRV